MPKDDSEKKPYNLKRKVHRIRTNIKKKIFDSDNTKERKHTAKTNLKKKVRQRSSGSVESNKA